MVPGKPSDILWSYSSTRPRMLFVEYDKDRKYDFSAVESRIEEVRRDKSYIWYKWKEGAVPGMEFEHFEGKPDRPPDKSRSLPDFASIKEILGGATFAGDDFIDTTKWKPKEAIIEDVLKDLVPMVAPLQDMPDKGVTRDKRPKKWPEQLNICIAAGLSRLLLVGPPGTGKTTAAADGHKFSVTCHEAMGPESMIGMFILKAGQTEWIDGPATLAMRSGGRLILNEIDRTSGECTSLLYALMDDKPAIMLPTGEYVTAATGYNVIGTSNGNPNEMSDPILDRIDAVMLAVEPHAGAVQAIALSTPSDKSSAVVAAMTNYYKSLSKSAWDWSAKATVRRMLSFGKLLAHGVEESIAAELVFGKAGKEILSCLATSAK